MTRVVSEEIPEALDGERLDRIVSLVIEVSRADASAVIVAGGVTVDGMAALSGKVRLRAGQTVAIDPSKLPVEEPPAADHSVAVDVVHADDDVIVVDKAAGVVVHPGAGNATGTLVNGLLAVFPEIAGVGEAHRPGIVHRLDVGTTGLLIVARTARAYDALVEMMASRAVTRRYTALVWGRPAAPIGTIDAAIGRDPRDPLRMAVVASGKPARTNYRVESTFGDPEVSLVSCELETGRTHQIRVHLQATGHPVVGDPSYGGARAPLVIGRPFLHAGGLEFLHPFSERHLAFTSALPSDLVQILERLRT
ncbi:MAG: RluA family pseudouridine synthase [Acidimicrobiia bacterium]